jgi:hypothetical protein
MSSAFRKELEALELPAGITRSDCAKWIFKVLLARQKGVSDKEFQARMDSDPIGHAVDLYLRDVIKNVGFKKKR